MARSVLYILCFLSLLLSCNRRGSNVEEPGYNPHLLKAGKYIPGEGRPIPMDSATPQQYFPVKSEYLKARPPETVLWQTAPPPENPPKYINAAPRRVDKSELAVPRYKHTRGIRKAAPWPEWKPTRLAYEENGRYPFFYLDLEQGLSESWIKFLMEGRNGRIWIGTWESGLNVWDGAGLMHFTTETGLSSNNTGAILEDRQGNIWIGTPNSIDVWDGTGFTHYPSKGLNVSRVGKIMEDQQGRIWIGSWKGGLRVWDGEGFTYFTTEEGLAGNRVQSLLESRDGKIWIGTTEGISIWDGKGFLEFTTAEGLPDNNVLCLLESPSGKIWIGTANGLCTWDGTELAHYTIEEGLSNNYIWYLAQSPNGKIWIATFNGLTVWDGQRFQRYNEADGLSHNIMLQLLADSHGKVWVGTQGGGVNVWEDNGLEHLAEDNGLIYDDIHSLLQTGDGRVWIGTQGGEFLEWKEDGFIRHFTPNNIRYNFIYSLLESRDGNIWIGTSVDGLHRWDGNGFYHLGLAEDRNNDVVASLLEDRRGNLWIGTAEGVIVKGKAGFEKYSTRQGLSDNIVPCLLEDNSGKIWIGTGNGITVWNDGALTHYLVTDGLGSRYAINCLLEARDGKIWIGTSRGLGIWDGAGFTFYTSREGLSHNVVLSLEQDPAGNIWAGTRDGLNRLTPLSSGEGIAIRTFNYEDGLRGQVIKNILISRENRLWLSGNKGIGRMPLEGRPADTSRPILFLREMTPFFEPVDWRQVKSAIQQGEGPAAGERQASPGAISFDLVLAFTNLPYRPVFPHYMNQLTFYWSATHSAPHKLQYSYFLEGDGRAWSPLIRENERTFQNLRPGEYTLLLRAVGENGRWSDTESFVFTILPPWWATNAAYLSYALAALVLLYALYRFQLNRRLAKAEARRLRELDTFKTNLYTNITHEFRTPLTVILGMAEQIRGQKQIRKLIRRNGQALLNLVNQMLDLRKLEVGTLQLEMVQGDIIPFLHYLCESFHSSAEAKGIGLSFHTNTDSLLMDYDPERLRQVVSNLLSNAIKFTPNGGKVKLFVSTISHHSDFRLLSSAIATGEGRPTSDFVQLRVEDNGQGLPPNELNKIFDRFYQVDATATRKGEGTGIGLALAKELVEAMGGSIEVESELNAGTVFRVTLPIRREAAKEEESPPSPLDPLKGKPTLTVENEWITVLPPAPLSLAPGYGEQGKEESTRTDQPVNKTTPSTKPLALIVEDNKDVAGYLKSCLEPNYRVEWADNGQRGLEKALELVPDIIISDVMMPEMDGFELCRTLKGDERTSHIPIILLTARATQEDRLEGLERGADAYLVKPFDRDELDVRLRKLVELRRQLREKYRYAGQIEEPHSGPDDPEMNFLRKLQHIIIDNLGNEAFKVEPDLCRAMAMSRPQLYRKLKALKDISPSEFIRDIRMQQARRLILQTQLNISEVAERVGFKDPSYFTRSYSAVFGESPSETREGAK